MGSSGQTKARCEQMAQYENKCQWNQCPSTTTMLPTTTTPPPTTSTLAPSTSSEPTCELDRNMRACVARGGSFECEKCNDSNNYHDDNFSNSHDKYSSSHDKFSSSQIMQ